MYKTTYLSPVGKIVLACEGEKLIGLWIEGQKYYGAGVLEQINEDEKSDMEIFRKTKDWLDRYFAGTKVEISELSLAPIGGEFRQKVWKMLCEIPYGEIVTYGYIAKKVALELGREQMSSQAIGGAVGHNPISIIIPCHRVVGANGSLTGYAGGVGIKEELLRLEGADMSKLFVPKKGTAI
jgi:O-6-methylguanine DNA methyltransferase